MRLDTPACTRGLHRSTRREYLFPLAAIGRCRLQGREAAALIKSFVTLKKRAVRGRPRILVACTSRRLSEAGRARTRATKLNRSAGKRKKSTASIWCTFGVAGSSTRGSGRQTARPESGHTAPSTLATFPQQQSAKSSMLRSRSREAPDLLSLGPKARSVSRNQRERRGQACPVDVGAAQVMLQNDHNCRSGRVCRILPGQEARGRAKAIEGLCIPADGV